MTKPQNTIYGFSAKLLDGTTVNLADLRGNVLLIANTASFCAFTPQYAGLEALFQTYSNRGFKVLAFPSNQFGKQEPGSASQIGAFCQKNYGVPFPVFDKSVINGPQAHPLFRLLKQQKPGLLGFLTGGRISWNFTKFLVNREGCVVARFGPSSSPKSLAPKIEELLDGTYSSS